MDEKQALSYMEKGTLFEIELKEHYGCFVSEYSKFPMEAEVLPPPFTSFKVTDVTIDEKGIFMTCQGLPLFLQPFVKPVQSFLEMSKNIGYIIFCFKDVGLEFEDDLLGLLPILRFDFWILEFPVAQGRIQLFIYR